MATQKEQIELLQDELKQIALELKSEQDANTSLRKEIEKYKEETYINSTIKVLMDNNKELKNHIDEVHAVLTDLHETLFQLTKQPDCHAVRNLKLRMQGFRDLLGPAAEEREKKWRPSISPLAPKKPK